MLKNPQDRRARRTGLQIKEAMLTFLEERPIHEIRVSDLCKVCQINRATFYDHYRDVYDLVQDMESDILLDLEALMDAVSDEQARAEDVSRQFFDFMETHRRSLSLLLSGERTREFCARLDARLMPFFEKKIRQSYRIPEEQTPELRCAMEFISSGYYRFFMNTLMASHRSFLAEAELCSRLSNACLDTLFQRL